MTRITVRLPEQLVNSLDKAAKKINRSRVQRPVLDTGPACLNDGSNNVIRKRSSEPVWY